SDAPGFILSALLTAQGSWESTRMRTTIFTSFLRAEDGTITTLEVPSPAAYIYAAVANSAGAIAGGFSDANGNHGGFIRAPSGKFTFFEFPPALRTCPFTPAILAMTPGGAILGSYCDSNFVRHGFLRTIDGTFTTIDPPNAAGTTPTSIDDSGIIT